MRSQRGLLSWLFGQTAVWKKHLKKHSWNPKQPFFLKDVWWNSHFPSTALELTWTNIYPLPDGTFASMIFLFIMDMVLFPGGLKVSRGQVGWFVFFSAGTHTAFFWNSCFVGMSCLQPVFLCVRCRVSCRPPKKTKRAGSDVDLFNFLKPMAEL